MKKLFRKPPGLWKILFFTLLLHTTNVHGSDTDQKDCCRQSRDLSSWFDSWSIYPSSSSWSMDSRIPMITDFDDSSRQERGKHRYRKKYRRYLLPLLLAYKLKFFTLIPVMIGGLILLTGATGMAGFFFALFAAVMGLKSGGHQREL